MVRKFQKKSCEWQDLFDGKSLAQIRVIVEDLISKYGESAFLEYDLFWDNWEFYINVEKKETPEEKAAREAKELAKKQKKEAADRAKFEKLKEEYGW